MKQPNIILCMTDDQGWGDVGYNGHSLLRTPNLDKMANEGLVFDRFYSAAPVCSPTRASCLIGRNPYRTGVFNANMGVLRPEEYTMMKFLKSKGYTTGHFGKWHLGTLSRTERDSNRGGAERNEEYNPPWEHDFDTCFSTEAKVPTWDPMKKPHNPNQKGWNALKDEDDFEVFGTSYWTSEGEKVTDNLEGDDSRVIMDRALPFIEKASKSNTPFLAVIWFHAPHWPCVADPKLFEHYKEKGMTDYAANFYGSIEGVDTQMGRLRETLKKCEIENNTMLWYCSDNGPEGDANPDTGSAGTFKGRKRDLYEGGVRVPGLLVWPEKVKSARSTSTACVTSDYLPTVMDALGENESPYPFDGTSILPLIENKDFKRENSIGFVFQGKSSWNTDRYKLYTDHWGENIELYDLLDDPCESKDLSKAKPELVEEMLKKYTSWVSGVKDSFEGKEYGRVSYNKLPQKWPSKK